MGRRGEVVMAKKSTPNARTAKAPTRPVAVEPEEEIVVVDDEDELGDDGFEVLDEGDLGDGDDDLAIDPLDVEDDVDGDGEEDEVAASEAAAKKSSRRRPKASSDDDDDEDAELIEDDDVEDDLAEILRGRIAGDEEDEEEDEDETSAKASVDGDDPDDEVSDEELASLRPRQADEFQCMSCFLLKTPAQLADSVNKLCRDCV